MQRANDPARIKHVFGRVPIAAIAGTSSSVSAWPIVLLRFFQLFVGDQSHAESLATETFAEHIQGQVATLDQVQFGIELLRRATRNGAKAIPTITESSDRVVKAISGLSATPRAIIILSRCLSLDIVTVSKIVDLNLADTKRLWLEAFLEVHKRLSSEVFDPNDPDRLVR